MSGGLVGPDEKLCRNEKARRDGGRVAALAEASRVGRRGGRQECAGSDGRLRMDNGTARHGTAQRADTAGN